MITLDSTTEEIDRASTIDLIQFAFSRLNAGFEVDTKIILMTLIKMENDILEIQSKLFPPKMRFVTDENGMAHLERDMRGR